ncbi:hypothetical protein PACTADRAFT_43876 [Pachysolen tannophilus NRRL Y-2460]|uniref:Protein phosphatase PP2A regulatory subunit A n=1 Tax=Pachysolen tannophilus NRRL Y-2460 TaxID=669874 RepID=A0A1E4TSE2_PACTA|nr:hypothetical protein PACTADRAFT_43876 [Pachysolen tannophilus NRRL Y-2460]
MTTPETNSDELLPIALLMDELKHDDVGSRVQAMKRLDTIALALNPERTRSELLPFLQDVVQDDEDEVITVIAEELAKFVQYVGGPAYATELIPVLENITYNEEPIVRDKAIHSLNVISKSFDDDQINSDFLPLIERLSEHKWFSHRVASTGLFESVILRVNSDLRKKLLGLYLKLVEDDTPMVRRAAAKHLPKIIDLLTEKFKENNIEEFNYDIISTMFQSLLNDNQDSVKFLSVDVLISILKHFKLNGDVSHEQELFNSVLILIHDESWRVRYMVADRFEQLVSSFNDPPSDIIRLIPEITSLMKDNEGEVRKAISKQLPGFCKLIKNSDVLLNDVIPCVESLSNDENEVVRSALASEITGLAPILGKDLTIEYLLPTFLNMLKDEFPEVRLNIISNLQIVNQVIGIQLLSKSLLPAITELAQDKQWRVRLAIIEQIPLLAEQLGVSFFDEELGELCMSWLWDPVYSIRNAAVVNLEKLTVIFGSGWAKAELIDRILSDKIDISNFIVRITSVFALTNLVPVVDENLVINDILPFILNLSEDKVPNIRFNVAKSLQEIVKALAKNQNSANKDEHLDIIKSKIIPTLEIFSKDEDVDVRFYAEKSIESVKKIVESF